MRSAFCLGLVSTGELPPFPGGDRIYACSSRREDKRIAQGETLGKHLAWRIPAPSGRGEAYMGGRNLSDDMPLFVPPLQGGKTLLGHNPRVSPWAIFYRSLREQRGDSYW